MLIPDFPLRFQLGSPRERLPRSSEDDVRTAFPEERQVRFLGAGAFGDTWRVGERVVKLIMNDDFPPERIQREIDASSVDHANVVRLVDVIEVRAAGAVRPALVFPYVKGTDLATKIQREGPIDDAGELRSLTYGLFAGLAAIASAGTIHRDVKPENVQLRMGNPAKPVILDLGLAYVAGMTSLTTYPAAVGTRPYMAPEVLRGEHAVRKSDVWSAAVTIHVAATGRHPWLETNEVVTNRELLARIERVQPELDVDDSELISVIEACLAPAAYRRPAAGRAAKALEGE